jgi:simple sugar transport system ATP-binding protein
VTSGAPLVELRGISKRYGELLANDRIELAIAPGEVHAILGENGAGKSTLVKILYGVVEPTAGEILWQGQAVRIGSPVEARSLGLGMVFQHFSLFDELTVAENIAVALSGDWTLSEVRRKLKDVSAAYGLTLEPDRAVWTLSAGERQRIEIVRCLLQSPKLLILDEPTSVLTPQESEHLFHTLQTLSGEGVAILYISHKLEEVRRLCRRATVHAGEVVGIAGVAGNGQNELFAALSGERLGPRADVIVISGTACGTADIEARRRLGAAFVPEERLGHAAAPGHRLSENTLVSHHGAGDVNRSGFLAFRAAKRLALSIVKSFDVRTPEADPQARKLSGGNLQKFVIGREMVRRPKLLVVDQPTWGVDAGAARLIRQALVDLAREGSAVLAISQDLDELFEVADRLAVIHDGHLSALRPTSDWTREAIGLEMLGEAGGATRAA